MSDRDTRRFHINFTCWKCGSHEIEESIECDCVDSLLNSSITNDKHGQVGLKYNSQVPGEITETVFRCAACSIRGVETLIADSREELFAFLQKEGMLEIDIPHHP